MNRWWTPAPAFILLIAAACSGPGPAPTQAPAAQPAPAVQTDPLPSWNDGASRRAIVSFVTRVTKEGGPDFVPVPERIATFDNDGTLWSERPLPFQVVFASDRVKALAPQHPEWRTRPPFASVLKGDMAGIAAAGEKGVLAVLAATHTGMTTDEFSSSVREWIARLGYLTPAEYKRKHLADAMDGGRSLAMPARADQEEQCALNS